MFGLNHPLVDEAEDHSIHDYGLEDLAYVQRNGESSFARLVQAAYSGVKLSVVYPAECRRVEVQEGKIILKAPPNVKSLTKAIYGSVRSTIDAVQAIREFRKTGGRA